MILTNEVSLRNSGFLYTHPLPLPPSLSLPPPPTHTHTYMLIIKEHLKLHKPLNVTELISSCNKKAEVI